MAVESAKAIRQRLVESGKRLREVRQTAEKEAEKRREAEPQIIPTAQSPLAQRSLR